MCVLLICVYIQVHYPQMSATVYMWRSQNNLWSQFSSTMWNPGIDLRSSGSAPRTFTHWAISLTPVGHIFMVALGKSDTQHLKDPQISERVHLWEADPAGYMWAWGFNAESLKAVEAARKTSLEKRRKAGTGEVGYLGPDVLEWEIITGSATLGPS